MGESGSLQSDAVVLMSETSVFGFPTPKPPLFSSASPASPVSEPSRNCQHWASVADSITVNYKSLSSRPNLAPDMMGRAYLVILTLRWHSNSSMRIIKDGRKSTYLVSFRRDTFCSSLKGSQLRFEAYGFDPPERDAVATMIL